ncbi:hypothetical protein SAMN04488030_2944 [Aliiroseovarius halocynthiae]|uniref:Mitochondrial inner membrane protein n=1 Tax=Aliiroseovarius halocynthiae TaxID=985055 RepID=A0A545SNK8_9RHOB|nr:hypothetical protein [Aliiroseovarius halocynthiae]TQV66541.1 hypothetical protein FIL88_12490 [Aliiroseovarius halocynthiae]SMR82591.1 hypothetical protein SAMN04488030_2944 [Aliiroseovarius halocynthiae]
MAKTPKTAKEKTEPVKDAEIVEEPKLDEEPEVTPDEPPKESSEPLVKQLDDVSAADAKDDVGEDLPTEAEVVADASDDQEDAITDGAEDAATDDVAEAEDEPQHVEPAQPAPAPARKSGSVFVPMLLGGAVAAALGFGAARFVDLQAPDDDPIEAEVLSLLDRVSSLESIGASQSDALKALQSDTSVDQLRGDTTATLDQLRTQFDAMNVKLSTLEGRLLTVEKLPQGSGMEAAAAAAAAYERELQQMRAMLDDELARITSQKEDAQTLQVSAAETAKAAAARAAMARVHAALETGQPFGDALFDLTENAGVAAPDALSSIAADGVASQQGLQASFPDAARAALDASVRAAVEAGEMDRVSAFFRTQLGTRSLEPKEGDDPDAILSRAEAALKTGDVNTALTELTAMPDAGQPALADWIARATQRRDALAAATDLSTQLNSN